MGSFLKLAKNAILIYEEQASAVRALRYIAKYVARKGPSALSRTIFRTSAKHSRSSDPSREILLAILVSGGVGDLVVVARYLRDLYHESGPLSFDLFSPQPTVSEWVFRHVPGVRQHFADVDFRTASNSYHVSLFASSFVQVRHNRLNPADDEAGSALAAAIYKIAQFNEEMHYYIANHPMMDRFLTQHLQFRNVTRATSLHSMSGTSYGGDQLTLSSNSAALRKFGLSGSRYVTVHNGFEVQNITSGSQSTKCYPHFDQVIPTLRKLFPEICFVQLGSKTSSPIAAVDLDLIGRTSLEEASTLIAGAIVHIDNESGMVHIASCHGTPCCVVYGPTPPDYFVYQGNAGLRPLVCGNCWWITKNWMDRCPRGFNDPICTHSQPPTAVAEKAALLIRKAVAVKEATAIHANSVT